MQDIKNKLEQFGSQAVFSFSGTILVIAIILFCFTQLAINANLNPKGIKLERLNREKTALVEENRMLQEELAEAKSITVISQIADKKLDLVEKDPTKIMYINDTSVVASAN